MKLGIILYMMIFSISSIVTAQEKTKKRDSIQIQEFDNHGGKSLEGESDAFPSSAEDVPVLELKSKDGVESFVDVDPVFPGGDEAMKEWIRKNLVYPKEDVENDNSGYVYVRFVVELDGSISSPTILKGISPTSSKEVLRLLTIMPKWIPGKLNGKLVRAYATIKVFFNYEW